MTLCGLHERNLTRRRLAALGATPSPEVGPFPDRGPCPGAGPGPCMKGRTRITERATWMRRCLKVRRDCDPALEAAYRELIPVVEIDGERAFTYFVEPESFHARVARVA